jgi:hypothetical protein
MGESEAVPSLWGCLSLPREIEFFLLLKISEEESFCLFTMVEADVKSSSSSF